MQTMSSHLVKISVNVVNYCTIISVIDNCFCDEQSSKGNNSKSINDRVTLYSAHRLMFVDTCIKFHEYSLSGFQVIERTRFL